MRHRLFAVLVPAKATAIIDAHLARTLMPLLRAHTITGYRLGGQMTGAWDPGYEPTADPNNWAVCQACDGTASHDGAACPDCADAAPNGRRPGTVAVLDPTRWVRHPGDIVRLPRLLAPDWRFPPGSTPTAWVDPAGVVWLRTTDEDVPAGEDTGATPPLLRQVLRDLRSRRRDVEPAPPSPRRRPTAADMAAPWRPPRHPPRDPFKPSAWAVAVVDAHC
ncbi:hypothetical protein [Micromonospora sp. WMMD1082]|uniref:hypothetical protein n=1 Tax=Micromonospora sp. WMMD1082 TaxID=3016104 RepID=UPI00241812DA|nr:hypothetical protein [Micromonospora sp. WMMD1082]MDG4795048.1 hypothetical protein [Micromonospora sp. WMMD1082]